MGCFFKVFQVFWVKIHSKLNTFRIKKQITILFQILGFYLKYYAILPKNQPILICPNGSAEQLFKMFIVFGMYNFWGKADGIQILKPSN